MSHTIVDLFAGCGGLSKGFELAGFNVVAAYENWDSAIACYNLNFNHSAKQLDLNDVDAAVQEIVPLKPTAIIGGPPCQDFSHAGKRIEAGRASLTESYANIIQQIRPRCFVMENVARAQSSHAYAEAREIFKAAGYGLTEQVLTASFCGVPQSRKRFFCIGALDEQDGFLDSRLLSRLSDHEMTIRDYLGDELGTEYYYRHPRNYNRRAIYSIDEPAPTMRGVNRPIPKGYPGHPKDACSVDGCVRPLSTYERARIQTFPADYKWIGSKTDQEQMIGNAVPVNLGKYVAEALLDYLNDSISNGQVVDIESFRSWLRQEKNLSSRSISDVISRLKRVNQLLVLSDDTDIDLYSMRLGKIDAFASQSSSIRSQLKRAAKLYLEFVQQTRPPLES